MAETATFDEPLSDDANQTVVQTIRSYRNEADLAKRSRLAQNRVNQDAYLGRQDWSHKIRGQSQEFLPKVAVAVEQFAGFVKRALTQFGDWYDPVLGRSSQSPLTTAQIRSLMNCYLEDLCIGDRVYGTLATALTDAVKMGSLDSLITLKVHGQMISGGRYAVEPGLSLGPDGALQEGEDQVRPSNEKQWKLRIDLVPLEDYYRDPTGEGLYEIHRTERDLSYVIARAEEGIYDAAAVDALIASMSTGERREDERRRPEARAQDDTTAPSPRPRVVIDEFWGTILDEDGRVLHENVLAVVANDKWLIRPPEPNPFWHGESPFVSVPLIRVPLSTLHKALMDHAVQLNLAANELFNLILDGGIASVWGVRQARLDDIEQPEEILAGVPQGYTIAVKSTLPPGAKALEQITEGQVPPDAMAVMEMLNREISASALSNELKLGSLPPKQVLATEIVELSQSQAVTLDSIIADIERDLITKTLRKCWLVILQNLGNVAREDIVDAVGVEGAFVLSRMSPAQRFSAFASSCAFKVHGLSATLTKVRDFQRMMALLQAVVQNPLLLQAFFKRFSPDKILAHLMKSLSVNPESIERSAEDFATMEQQLKELAAFSQLVARGQGGAGLAAEDTGEPSLPAEINQASNPLTGMTGQ